MKRMPHRGDQVRLAEELEIDQGYLSKISTGARTPGLALRLLFKRRFRIPVEDWDEPVKDENKGAA
jgi:hypothetical protein